MKRSNYLWAVLMAATLSLNACISEENENTETGEKTARLELKLAGTPETGTRATGAALPTSEDNINTIAVGIFDHSTGETNTIAEPVLEEGVYKINCKAGTCDIIVVANAPTGTFKGVASKSLFIAKTVELAATAQSGIQVATNLPMSGEAANVKFVAGDTKEQTIEINRLVSRVSISSIKTAFDPKGQYANAKFVAKKIFLHNAKSKSTVAENNAGALTTTVPLSGKTGGQNPYLQTAISPEVTFPGNAHTTKYWFYTFPNADTGKPTKLVIYGSFDADGDGSGAAVDTYYPVVVNKQQTGTTITGGTDADRGTATIVRNATYDIAATIKGIGVDDPDKDINPATLKLTVTVAGWELDIKQNVTFE